MILKKEVLVHLSSVFFHKAHTPIHVAYCALVFAESSYIYGTVAGVMGVVIVAGGVFHTLESKL